MKKHIAKLLLAALLAPALARAIPLVWDADSATVGAQDGAGIWDTTSTNWWDGVANPAWVNGTNTAIFGATNGPAGTVTLGEPIVAGALSFTNTGGGDYTLDGTNALTLIIPQTNVSPSITVAAGLTASISARVLATNANTYKRGLGTLNILGSFVGTGRDTHLVGGIINFAGTNLAATKFLVGSANVGNATVLNWNSGVGVVAGNFLGIGDNASGTLNMNGGSLGANNGSGMFIGNSVGSTGILNMAGGIFTNVTGPLWIGASYSGTQTTQPTWGYLNLTGGVFNFTGTKIQLTGVMTGQTAAVNLDGGTLNLNGGPITSGVGSSTFNFNGGVLRFTASNPNALIVKRANVRNGGALFDLASGFSATVAQTLEHSDIGGDDAADGGLTKRGSNSTLTLTGNNTYNGGTRVHAGTLQMGGGGNSGTVGPGDVTISNNAQFVFRRTDAIVFTNKVTGLGNGGVFVQATGTVTIVGTGNVWGLTYPQQGILEFDLGDGGTFTGTGKFSMNGTSNAVVNWKSGTGNLATGDFITFADNVAGTSTLNVVGGTLNFLNTANRVLIGNQSVGIVNVSGGTLNIGNGGSSQVQIIIGGDSQYDQSNARGFLNISGTGTVVIASGSQLILGANTGIRTNASGTINLDGGTLQLARAITPSNGLAYFNFNGGLLKPAINSATFIPWLTRANIRDGGAHLDTSLGSVTIAQPLDHSDIPGDSATDGGLTKLGTGTLTLTGTNTFNGPTRILAGTLALATDGSILTSTNIHIETNATLDVSARTDASFNLAPAQTLTGGGTLTGTVNNDGIVAPGTSPGLLTITADYAQTNGTLAIELGGLTAATEHDQLIVAGNATLGGNLTVTLTTNFTPAIGDTFLILAAGTLTGTFATTNLPALAPTNAWTVDYLANALLLSITSVTPPPSNGYSAYSNLHALALGETGDDDTDGYANLYEYVTGSNPTNSGSNSALTAARTNGLFALKFLRDTNTVDATLIIEGANSAANDADWIGFATNIAGSWGSATNVIEDGNQPANVTAFDAAPAATNRFLRLRITRP